MTLNKNDIRTLAVIAKGGFTFKGDSHFRTYRQATMILNRLERAGLVKREDHDQKMFVMTPEGRDAHKYPRGYSVRDVAAEYGAGL